MANKFEKEALFNDYFDLAVRVMPAYEEVFSIEGICEQMFGTSPEIDGQFADAEAAAEAVAKVRASSAWNTLERLYEYAVAGILPADTEAEEIVIGGSEVLTMLEYENDSVSDEWHSVVELGDARFALDDGIDVSAENVALLANVDVRTVRNAISAGNLLAAKVEGKTRVNNQSARQWLSGRRGFTPTRVAGRDVLDMAKVRTAAEFGAALAGRRNDLDLPLVGDKESGLPSSVGADAIAAIENGSFQLPLDAVFPLADFYQIDRKEMLGAVMRVFYPEQMKALADIAG